jgi:hypothetical protein
MPQALDPLYRLSVLGDVLKTMHVSKFKDIPPREGTFILCCMWYFSIRVLSIPYQIDPGDICLFVELVQVFDEQSSILTSKVDYPQSTFPLGLCAFFPDYKGLCALLAFLASCIQKFQSLAQPFHQSYLVEPVLILHN